MKICLFGVTGIPTGNHHIKDARLDQADKLVEAQKKIYAQVVLADEKELAVCDAILTSRADSAATRLTSCAVAVLLHYATHPQVKV